VDKYAELSLEQIVALATEKQTALEALFAIETPTPAQVAEAEALFAEVQDIKAAQKDRETAGDRFAALKTAFADSNKEAEAEVPEGEVRNIDNPERAESEVKPVEEAPVVPEGHVAPADGESEAPKVQARGGVAALAAKTAKPETPKRPGSGPVSIVAAANVDGFSTGQSLSNLTDVAKAVIAKAKGFAPPQGDGTTENIQRFGTASFALDFPEDLIIDRHTDVEEVLRRATDESRLEGGSLVAAGGWCAPSETVYDLTQDATTEGMLSLPEVAVRRGGMRWPISPNFADFYANPGFIQTEAQAIAGTAKPCIEVDCPDFAEARLDAEGICIKVPILTNAGYPEYVRNFVEGSLIAHQHWINANVIGRVVTAAGAARVITGLGSTLADTLEGLELLADQTRQKYRLSMNRTLEVVAPFWVRGAVRADLSRRNGLAFEQVTDQQIAAHFRARKLNVQFVYDWQPLDETAEVYPTTFNVVMYPAGTFVKGTADIINLSTIYDAASLQQNVYTGLFTEQGLLVAKQKFHADLVTLPVCNAGRTGAADLTCV
jgi:hypothetical protein